MDFTDTIPVTTRFAPSPSGYLHVGNMRAALWNYLFARKNNGRFMVRIENTDPKRSESLYTKAITRDLDALGIVYDNYLTQQTEHNRYLNDVKRLRTSSAIYPCFCRTEELEAQKKSQIQKGQPPRYTRHCRSLTQAQRDALIAAHTPHVWRFATPLNGELQIADPMRNKQITFALTTIEDFIVQRTDGSFVFLLTNILDDIHGKVTHVIRGEDHISNTPKQLLLCKALNAPQPQYIHTALIVDAQKKPLAKRNQAFTIDTLLQDGYLATALCNFLARLGCRFTSNALLTMDELATQFTLSGLSTASVAFDRAQLHYWQKKALAELSPDGWQQWVAKALSKHTYLTPNDSNAFTRWIRYNATHFADVTLWATALASAPLSVEAQNSLCPDHSAILQTALTYVTHNPKTNWHSLVSHVKQQTHKTGKALFMPLRIALSGQIHGPDLQSLWTMLTETARSQRLARTLNFSKTIVMT